MQDSAGKAGVFYDMNQHEKLTPENSRTAIEGGSTLPVTETDVHNGLESKAPTDDWQAK
jgi:hypothetical protein